MIYIRYWRHTLIYTAVWGWRPTWLSPLWKSEQNPHHFYPPLMTNGLCTGETQAPKIRKQRMSYLHNDIMIYKNTTYRWLSMCVFRWGKFYDCVTEMLCVVTKFGMKTNMPSYLCHFCVGVNFRYQCTIANNAKCTYTRKFPRYSNVSIYT